MGTSLPTSQPSSETNRRSSVIATSTRRVRVGKGRVLTATPVFDTYWRFAAERQTLFLRRLSGADPPWTGDPVLRQNRFTNAYRASDRVSQYLIRHVLYSGEQSTEEVVFRCLLFKLFNRVDTWEMLASEFGVPAWRSFDIDRYSDILDRRMAGGKPVYSAAYIMPPPRLGSSRKHRDHLILLSRMMLDGIPLAIERARHLSEIFGLLRSYPSIGGFLAFQYTIDLNYSALTGFSESDFVVAGPGARRGLRKCFFDTDGLTDEEVIRAVTDVADREFERLELRFESLWGRCLHPVDCQNLFCEVDKYARVVHPELNGKSGRTRIKQRFVPKSEPLPQWYPPKWGLDVPATTEEDVRLPEVG